MGDLSAHFSRSEFTCKCGCGTVKVDAHLVQHLEVLRSRAGRPLRIVSGYRCPAHNRRVGGARFSQHLMGTAADIPAGYATLDAARSAGFTGIGHRNGWAVHVDTRSSRTVITWSY